VSRDIVICDLRFGLLNGIAASNRGMTKEIRRPGSHSSFVILSSFDCQPRFGFVIRHFLKPAAAPRIRLAGATVL
jgi:hypothetical protein